MFFGSQHPNHPGDWLVESIKIVAQGDRRLNIMGTVNQQRLALPDCPLQPARPLGLRYALLDGSQINLPALFL
jgi:hypothetical protein